MKKTSNIVKLFIRWAGGKQTIIKYLLENLPPENTFKKCYEPFVGAGSLFFANGFTKSVLWDVNADLINSYRHIKSNSEGVFDQLKYHRKKLNPNLPSLVHLNEISKKLKGAELSVKPYQNILNAIKERDLAYLDPLCPALNGNQNLRQFTVAKFSENDQIGLSEFAKELSIKKCFVMISNSQAPLIQKLYKSWNIEIIPVTRSVSCKKERIKINELIIN